MESDSSLLSGGDTTEISPPAPARPRNEDQSRERLVFFFVFFSFSRCSRSRSGLLLLHMNHSGCCFLFSMTGCFLIYDYA